MIEGGIGAPTSLLSLNSEEGTAPGKIVVERPGVSGWAALRCACAEAGPRSGPRPPPERMATGCWYQCSLDEDIDAECCPSGCSSINPASSLVFTQSVPLLAQPHLKRDFPDLQKGGMDPPNLSSTSSSSLSSSAQRIIFTKPMPHLWTSIISRLDLVVICKVPPSP
uniref:Uncharacterized protein n=1 Tax=Molossus molossus TaxID=27622 RepID=A0A7J8JWJ1_MOLMO|nr:hypothetical protein HJG59_007879 [Molossus molossus]